MGGLLLVPFFLIRFGLLGALDRTAIGRAAYFPPLRGNEKIAYWIYQLSNVGILVYMFFLRIPVVPQAFFYAGIVVYAAGNALLVLAMVNFAHPSAGGINRKGLYRISRNPMYLAYFVYFLGCVLLTQSLVLLGVVLIFQLTAHWIILSEERWCIQSFGADYLQYMKKVRRHF